MKKTLYTIYDLVALQIMGNIMTMPNHAPAIRAFHDALAAKDSPLNAHPRDYNLIALGIIDDTGRIFVDDDMPQTVATGAQWAAATETPNLNLEK
jgi:hypothetical protein